MKAVCELPSESVALICQVPLLSDSVNRLKCHSPAAALSLAAICYGTTCTYPYWPAWKCGSTPQITR
jgi:hypothetical protein